MGGAKGKVRRRRARAWVGAPKLRPLLVSLADLTLDPKNARKHDERNLRAIETSLERFGQLKPIVVREGVVVAGNGTMVVAVKLGWTHLAAVAVDSLTREDAIAFGIMDNKSAELADWDLPALGDLFRQLPEEAHGFTGFEPVEIRPLLQGEMSPPRTESGSDGRPRSVTFSPDQWQIVKGAIAKVKDAEEGPADDSNGRCLELICADFLAG